MSEQKTPPAIAPKCVDCANRMKITHFGENETFSFVCSIMPLTPMVNIENVGVIPNVKDCSEFVEAGNEMAVIPLFELRKHHAYFDNKSLYMQRGDAENLISSLSNLPVTIL